MADKPPRKLTPGPGGIAIPPAHERGPDSPLPPPDREVIAIWLRDIKDGQDAISRRLPAIEREQAEQREQIRELRESATIQREVRQELREQGKMIAEFAGDLRDLIRSDSHQTVDMGKLEARVTASVAQRVDANAELAQAEAKSSARSTSRRWSTVGTVLGTVLAAAIATAVQECAKPEPPPQPTYPSPRH